MDLDRYFVPQGSSDRRTAELKKQGEEKDSERRRKQADQDYYGFGDLGDYPADMYLGYHLK